MCQRKKNQSKEEDNDREGREREEVQVSEENCEFLSGTKRDVGGLTRGSELFALSIFLR